MAWQCAVTGETYLYQVLPFGYQLSPFAFCTAMSVFTRVLRSPDVATADRGKPEALLRAIKHDLLSRGRDAHVQHAILRQFVSCLSSGLSGPLSLDGRVPCTRNRAHARSCQHCSRRSGPQNHCVPG